MDNKRNYYLASAGIAATIVGSTLIGNGLDTSHNHDLQLDPKPLIEKTDININLPIFQETSDPLEVCNTPEKKYISEKLTMEVGFGIESKDTYAILSMDDC